MAKMDKHIKAFHNAFIEIAKYLIVLEPDVINWYSFDDYEMDSYPHNRKKYKYHRLVLDQLHRAHSAKVEDIEHCYGIRLTQVFGGNEDQDQMPHFYVVKHNDKFFKIPGYYSSMGGSTLYWADIHEVVPVEKTVTLYKRVFSAEHDIEDGTDILEHYLNQANVDYEQEEDSF